MSWRLLRWLWRRPVAATIAADLTSDLGAAAVENEGIPVTVAATVADELTAGVVLNSSTAVSGAVSAALTDDLGAATRITLSIYFIPPAPGDPRVAVVSH